MRLISDRYLKGIKASVGFPKNHVRNLEKYNGRFLYLKYTTKPGEEVINKHYYRYKQIIKNLMNSLIKEQIEIEDKIN